MAGLTGWHLLILITVVVILSGAKRLPEMARSLGQSARILKGEIHDMSNHDAAGTAAPPTTPPPAGQDAARPAAPAPVTPAPVREQPTTTTGPPLGHRAA